MQVNKAGSLVSFHQAGLPEICSCVTNQTCASGCAIVLSAPKKAKKQVRVSRHRLLFSPPITTLLIASTPAAPTIVSEHGFVEAEIDSQPATEPAAVEDSAEARPAPAAAPGPEHPDPRRRRRRGRGGRGRGGTHAAARAAANIPAVGATEDATPVAAAPSETAGAEPATNAAARASKGTVVLAIGLPGSARVHGSSATTSLRYRATCCDRCCLTIPPDSVFRT